MCIDVLTETLFLGSIIRKGSCTIDILWKSGHPIDFFPWKSEGPKKQRGWLNHWAVGSAPTAYSFCSWLIGRENMSTIRDPLTRAETTLLSVCIKIDREFIARATNRIINEPLSAISRSFWSVWLINLLGILTTHQPHDRSPNEISYLYCKYLTIITSKPTSVSSTITSSHCHSYLFFVYLRMRLTIVSSNRGMFANSAGWILIENNYYIGIRLRVGVIR